jgi:SAM-dependent methyltransferase
MSAHGSTQDQDTQADRETAAELSASAVSAGYAEVTQDASIRANRAWWDAEADAYQAEHGASLGGDSGGADFVWSPEALREQDAQLLGDPAELAGNTILEVGCGAAQCARWLVTQGARVVAFDLSAGQLRHAQQLDRRLGIPVTALLQADATALPLRDQSIDIACSAFGAVPFVADSAAIHREVARVLRPGGRWVFSVTHPMRWCFLDDPGPDGLTIERSYFDRRPYVELGEDGEPVYVEQHRTLGDRVREIVGAGLTLLDVIEPEWPDGLEQIWGQWGPLRGRLFPGTAIYVCQKPDGWVNAPQKPA